MAELDQVQKILIQGRQAIAAIAPVPTRVVGVLARLGLVAPFKRAATATAATLPRTGGPEPCAAVRAGARSGLVEWRTTGLGRLGQLARHQARRVPGTQPVDVRPGCRCGGEVNDAQLAA